MNPSGDPLAVGGAGRPQPLFGVPRCKAMRCMSPCRRRRPSPRDKDYNTVRAVINGMIDRRPLAVVGCRDTADVARGITFARAHRLPECVYLERVSG